MKEVEKLKEQILKEYPRLDLNSEFSFACHSGVPCFNKCCADVNIFLTPYDIIRLKNRLGITSAEFLRKYTIAPFDEKLKYPVILFMMTEDDKKACQFVGPQGCTVYEDRPWACRMYPLGMASPGETNQELNKEFYFLLKEDVCKGFNEDRKQTVAEWIKDQGIEEYDKMGEDWKNLTTHPFFQQEDATLTPQKVEMFFTVCYNVDKYRDFVFGSTFLDKFDVDEATVAAIKEDDVALLKFGYKWLRFALFGEKTLAVKSDVIETKKAQMDEDAKENKEDE